MSSRDVRTPWPPSCGSPSPEGWGFLPHAPSYKSTSPHQPPAGPPGRPRTLHPLRRRPMRAFLYGLAAALLLVPAGTTGAGGDKPAQKKDTAAAKAALDGDQPAMKKLLVITESKGFRHDCVNRKGQEYCLVETTLMDLGKKSGAFDAVCTQDSRSAITAENLKNFDAVFFYPTVTLRLSA